LIWVGDNDPVKYKALEQMPLMEYWHRLNNKKADSRKAIEASRKAQSKNKRGRR